MVGNDANRSKKMIYMFILMSSGWHCKEYERMSDAVYDAQNHIDNGDTVAFQDDKEYFADQMKISVDDIKEVK